MIAVLNGAVLRRLVSRLDSAVRAEPTLALPRGRLLAPLWLLAAMGRDADRALGDDQVAVERLRLLAASGNGHGGMLALLSAVAPDDAGPAAAALALASTTPVPPGLIHPGGLVIVALAAGRAGRQVGVGGSLVENVLGVAVAASPAEAVSRALDSGLSQEGLLAVLGGLVPHEAADSRVAGTLAAFLADPYERRRWSCLQALFAEVQRNVADTNWEAAPPVTLTLTAAAPACAGSELRLIVGPPLSDVEGSSTDPGALLTMLAQHQATVVFASASEGPLTAEIIATDPGARSVTVKVPDAARAGWVGITVGTLRTGTNRDRATLRRRWLELNTKVTCLSGSPVPAETIVDLPAPPKPPKAGGARFEGGRPSVVDFSAHPDLVEAGDPFELRWQVEGAAGVVIRPGPGSVESLGSAMLTASDERRTLAFTLSATSPCGSAESQVPVRVRVRIHTLQITQGGRSEPVVRGQPLTLKLGYAPADAVVVGRLIIGDRTLSLEGGNGSMSGEIPPDAAVTGLRGRVTLSDPDGPPEDERGFGPLDLVKPQARRIVLVRPAIFGDELRRVTAGEARVAIVAAERAAGAVVQPCEPVWIEDEDLIFEGDAGEPDAPATLAILERLGALAARHPGLESALWVALVPSRGDRGAAAAGPADAASMVAVCTLDQLGAVLAAPAPSVLPATTRLRVIGTLEHDGSFQGEPSLVEERSAGPGSKVDTGLEASVLDGRGNVQSQTPVRMIRSGLPARLVALVPVGPDSIAVELVSEGDSATTIRRALRLRALEREAEELLPVEPVVARFRRPQGTPGIEHVKWDGATLRWEIAEARRPRCSLWIEIRRQGVWFRAFGLSECQTAIKLPLHRLGPGQPGDRVRIVAADGWHQVARPSGGLPLPEIPTVRVVARIAGGGRFWADVETGTNESEPELFWKAGRTVGHGTMFRVPTDFDGEVVLTARIGDLTVTDTRLARAPAPGRRRGGKLALHG